METNTSAPDSELPKYSCRTQKDTNPSFGHAPISNFEGTTGDNAPDKHDSLVLGFGPIVPRWDVTPPGGTKLQYFVRVDTFPDNDEAKIAAKKFQAAANSWTDLGIGLAFSQTTDRESANFYLVYQANTKFNKGVLAQAFFPHEVDQDVIVYSYAFEDSNKSILEEIFLHEIGHILGLRHEFAIEADDEGNGPEGLGAKQFLAKNPDSVMGYRHFPPEMQDSDRTQTVAFYKVPNGFLIGNSPVTDFQPKIRKNP
ncbi:Peptidase_M10 domain-containing protein [Fusarium acuminatum]|jgi:hypothetical protein|uniref:Peptidase_M10 domain-containing protein n=1 Tax=Fusarium acuminatum TaxID=5515 RepID=A0ABZ2WQ85_9HYPO